MRAKVLNELSGQRTFAVVFDKDEPFIASLAEFAQKYHLTGSHFTATGAFRDVILEIFERPKKTYKEIPVNEQVEVLSLMGNITLDENDKAHIHAHGVFGWTDGSAIGGHIKEAHVWPTLEVMLVEEPGYLKRRLDPETGLALIDFEAVEQTS